MRTVSVALAALLLTAPAVRAGEKGLAGNWTVTVFERGTGLTPWLLKLERKDGKLRADLETAKKFPPSELKKFRLEGKTLAFTVSFRGAAFEFEFPVPKGAAKTLVGSMQVGPGQILAARLQATREESLTFQEPKAPPKLSFEEAKKLVARAAEDPRAFNAAGVLFREAKENKATAEEVKGWADSLARAAENYGPRWRQQVTLHLGAALAVSGDYPEVAVEFARRAVKASQKGSAEAQMRALSLLEAALEKAGKKDELKTVQAQIEQLEPRGHKEALADLPFRAKPAPARKGTQAALVELFTGAMCPPCVAADMAFDGLEKTYKPGDVVLLQYHLHIPGPDALTTPESQARQEYYRKQFGDDVRGTPAIIFNGQRVQSGGGPRAAAEAKYKEYLGAIEPLLKEKGKAEIKAGAVRKGEKIHITAEVTKLEKPGAKVKLRLALVQEWVRYPGGNGLTYHARVVRAMPGGADGFALPKASGKHKASVDLGELRKSLKEFLDGVKGYPTQTLPLRFRDLSVVAFVQNDETREVLQAVEVPIKE